MSVSNKAIKVTYLGVTKLQISLTENKSCNVYSLRLHKIAKQSVNHHILLIDVSLSMKNDINELNRRIKMTLEALKTGGNNYVSIILYSGHDEAYRIVNAVKCDTTAYKMARVFEILDAELYTRSMTVISEPLEIALDIIKVLGGVCNKHHIVLFTDGCLVPYKWSIKEEEVRIIAIAKLCHDKGIFFNAIGFGNYYDRNFLKQLIEVVGTGNLNHINDIKDYSKLMVTLAKNINTQAVIDCTILNEDYFILNTVQRKYTSEKIQSFTHEEEVLVATFDGPLKINDKIIRSPSTKILDEAIREDFLYGLSLYHIINEDIESSEVTLAETGDLGAYLLLRNCYSFAEKGTAIKTLSELLHDPCKRFQKGRVNISIPTLEEEPLCLLEILQEILQDKDSKLLWDYSYPYKRIGIQVQPDEDHYHFIRPTIGYGEVTSVSIGSKKLNIGVKVKISGEVIDETTKLKMDAHIFREYNLVVNGNVNTAFIWCKLSKSLKKKFRKAKIIKSTINLWGEEIITLDLRSVKSTNKRLLKSMTLQDIATYLYRIEVLKCEQHAVNQLLTELNKTLPITPKDKDYFNKKILDKYHIDSTGCYTPPTTNQLESSKLSYEVYPAKILTWHIEEFPQKLEEINAISRYSEQIANKSSIEAIEILKVAALKIRNEKEDLTYRINLVRLSCGLNDKTPFLWDKEIIKQKVQTDPVLKVNAVIGEKVLISTTSVNGLTLRQDYYTILTCCN